MSALVTNVGGYLFTVGNSGLTQTNANNSVFIPIGITSGVRESDDLGSIQEPEIPILWPTPPVAVVPPPTVAPPPVMTVPPPVVLPPVTGCGSLCVANPPDVTPTPAPEPGTMALFAVALIAALAWRRI
jgi:hypothetical protein